MSCPCLYCNPDAGVPLTSGITVVYTRHGHREWQTGWSCHDDAELFAAWLTDVGAAIDVEVVEL